VALLAWLPFLLGQRAAYSVPTWVPPPTLENGAHLCGNIFLPGSLVLVLIAAWLYRLTRGANGPAARSADAGDVTAQAGLTGLLLLPPLLVLFSYAVQPALVNRYGLPAILGLAPVAAWGLARLSRPWLIGLGVVLALVGVYNQGGLAEGAIGLNLEVQGGLKAQAAVFRQRDEKTDKLIDTLRRNTGPEPVYFEAPYHLNVVVHYAPNLRDRCFFLDWEAGQFGPADPFRTFVRDAARLEQRYYPQGGLRPWSEVRQAKQFYLVPHPAFYSSNLSSLVGRYRGFKAQEVGVGAGVFLLTAEGG
jgi:hypothetical protein